jgi:hypothetical protein
MQGKTVSELIGDVLSSYLGPNTAKTAVKTFSKKELGLSPEKLTATNVPKLMDGMRPMLRTLLGEDVTEVLVAIIQREVGQ